MGACRPTALRPRAPSLRAALHPIPPAIRPPREERLGPEPCGPCTLPPPPDSPKPRAPHPHMVHRRPAATPHAPARARQPSRGSTHSPCRPPETSPPRRARPRGRCPRRPNPHPRAIQAPIPSRPAHPAARAPLVTHPLVAPTPRRAPTPCSSAQTHPPAPLRAHPPPRTRPQPPPPPRMRAPPVPTLPARPATSAVRPALPVHARPHARPNTRRASRTRLGDSAARRGLRDHPAKSERCATSGE